MLDSILAGQLPDGHTVALSSTDATTQTGIKTAVDTLDDVVFTNSSAYNLTTSKSSVQGGVYQSGTPDTLTDNDTGAILLNSTHGQMVELMAGSDLVGDVGLQARTSGGISTVYRDEDLDETAVALKAGAGQIYWIQVTNLDATPIYVHFYDVAQGSVTVGTTGELCSFCIPSQGDANGAGAVMNFNHGIEFSTAITIAATTAIGGSSGPGTNECLINVGYA